VEAARSPPSLLRPKVSQFRPERWSSKAEEISPTSPTPNRTSTGLTADRAHRVRIAAIEGEIAAEIEEEIAVGEVDVRVVAAAVADAAGVADAAAAVDTAAEAVEDTSHGSSRIRTDEDEKGRNRRVAAFL